MGKPTIFPFDPVAALNSLKRSLASSGGSALIGFIQSGTGAVLRTLQSKARDNIDTRDFGAISDGTTQQSIVQATLTSIPIRGANAVTNAPQAKFALNALTFPRRLHFDYHLEDETTSPGYLSGGSGERVFFSAASNYAAVNDGQGNDPTGATVNEWRFTAPFHPGICIDVRKTLSGHDAYLAPGQSRLSPARASLNFLDDRCGVFRMVYENYLAYDTFSGMALHAWRRKVVLNGIGTAQWTTVPTVGTTITGVLSGAIGHLQAVSAGATTVESFSRAFIPGERLTDNNETTVATISTVDYSEDATAPLAVNPWTGAWTIGDRPPRVGSEILNVAGNIKIVPTRGTSFVQPKTVTAPTLILGESEESGSPHQLGIQYDPAKKTAAFRRLQIVKNDLTTVAGEILPTSWAAAFGDAGIVDTNSYNVASITNSSPGNYDIVYITPITRAFGMHFTGGDGYYMIGWFIGVTFQGLNGCTVTVANPAGVLTDIPVSASISVKMEAADV